jgi:catechol 2,3-dioxygenase-like lactoylglutathione lyase family enzyme
MSQSAAGNLHHIELWVPDLTRAITQWGWLLGQLGYSPFQDWPHGRSWRLGSHYLVIEQSPAMTDASHDRLRPGLNHLAFHAGTRLRVDALTAEAPEHGWTLLFPDRHPYAGGPDHYATYLANTDGFEVELVALLGAAPPVALVRNSPVGVAPGPQPTPGRRPGAGLIPDGFCADHGEPPQHGRFTAPGHGTAPCCGNTPR